MCLILKTAATELIPILPRPVNGTDFFPEAGRRDFAESGSCGELSFVIS